MSRYMHATSVTDCIIFTIRIRIRVCIGTSTYLVILLSRNLMKTLLTGLSDLRAYENKNIFLRFAH